MTLTDLLESKWKDSNHPALIVDGVDIYFKQILDSSAQHLKEIRKGDTVAIIGDFNPQSISDLFHLIDRGAILVPLSDLTRKDHEYFFDTAFVKWVVENGDVSERFPSGSSELLDQLRMREHSGLILFSSGTTGRPKAILHDLTLFLARFNTPRPALRTLGFLLFDHIGGINTLLHTLFNAGTVICTTNREPSNVLFLCEKYEIQVLPTTPTFLRLLLMSGAIPGEISSSLKVITYGTERMDQGTLETIADLLPNVDIRQTFGMSELGILRVKSKARNSLYMKIGGEGVEWKVENGLLLIRSQTRMLGYLNAESPFDAEGWYQTNDLVDVDGDYIKVVGRNNDVVNVGGLKFLLSEVERIAYGHHAIELATASACANPITGQHIELIVQLKNNDQTSIAELKEFFAGTLPSQMRPRRILLSKINVGHRHKKL
jgi:long-chain acyl-CoA synthetase